MIKEVALREIRTRARTKAFQVITTILVLAAIAGPLVAALWPEGSDDLREVTIGLVDVAPETEAQILLFAEGALDVTIEDFSGSDQEAIDQALADENADVVMQAGPILAWNEEVDFEIATLLNAVIQQQDAVARAAAAGLSQSEIVTLFTPVEVEERFADESDSSDALRSGVAFVGLMAAFILPQAFGQLTMLSVVEEKSTRVIEVLLSHLRPRQLLLGKIIGLGALAAAQLAVVVTGLAAAMLLTNAIDIPASVWRFVPILLVSILGGLAIYNTTFALLGSLISRQEDASQVMLPVFIPLMAGYLVGQSAVFGNAESTLVKFLSYFPLTSPMLLPVRVARDAIEPWEIALSLGLLAVGVWVLVALAARVYEFTLLHTGSRVSWGQLIRLSRGASLD